MRAVTSAMTPPGRALVTQRGRFTNHLRCAIAPPRPARIAGAVVVERAVSDDWPISGRALTLGITGHRAANAAFAANRVAIAQALGQIMDVAQAACPPTPQLVSPLAQGTDMLAAELAVARGWRVIAPLPFGIAINIAVNIDDPAQRLAWLVRQAVTPETASLAHAMQDLAAQAHCRAFDHDDALAETLMRTGANAGALDALVADHAAAAAAIVIDASAAVVAVWDGVSPGGRGGTRHTMVQALERGRPVLWIDARAPKTGAWLTAPDDLTQVGDGDGVIDWAGFAAWCGTHGSV